MPVELDVRKLGNRYRRELVGGRLRGKGKKGAEVESEVREMTEEAMHC